MNILDVLLSMACCSAALAQTAAQTADEIMTKVAENQDRAQAARAAFVYRQNILIRMKRNNGKVAREEVRDLTVIPSDSGTKRELVHFEGKYEKSGRFVTYDKPGFKYKDVDIDGAIAENMAEDFANSKSSRDGVSANMFPLTSKRLAAYRFTLKGTEAYRDREVFKIDFEPKENKGMDCDDNNSCWAGEALVDRVEFQPVLITTHLSFGIPVAVKLLLGTDVKHMGFKVTYQKFEGVWFPVTYGGELKVRAAFLYARNISIGVQNSEFKHADVATHVSFDDPAKNSNLP